MLTVLAVLGGALPASAAPGSQTPWEQSVTAEQRARALALFRQGNSSFSESEYARAAERYRQALKVWDHPRIHGNLATALIHLDSMVEAWKHLEKALAYGAKPFVRHVHARLVTQRKLLANQISRLSVACSVAKASVTVDGKPLFVGPGKRQVLVRTGNHEVVAKRSGYLTRSVRLFAAGGASPSVSLTPIPLADASVRQRRWAAWKPWLVVGAGALVGLAGLPLGQASTSARARFEEGFLRECPMGCVDADIPADVKEHKSSARLFNRLEVTTYVLGGATLVAGAVLAYMNREREIRLSESGARVALSPILSPRSVGLAMGLRF